MTPETKAKLLHDPDWGQTPWENLTKEELILECARMWSAVNHARSVLRQIRDTNHPFWQKDGLGGQALLRSEEIMKDIPETEKNYRAFGRYADSCLFEGTQKWQICDNCQDMWARPGPRSDPGYCPGCHHTQKGEFLLRPLTLADLRPQKGEPI